jgi:phytoene synthase
VRLGLASRLDPADAQCWALAHRHYENFSVLSRLAPRDLRIHLARVYAFCRVTDDLGDESGPQAPELLRAWQADLRRLFAGAVPDHPVLKALGRTVAAYGLSPQPFLDLIEANLQDQVIHSYRNWEELKAYCMLSAAPVGRIVLRLFRVASPLTEPLSDDVCVGLQLANFAQDVRIDQKKGRTYLLQEDLARGVPAAVRAMCDRAESLLLSGRRLEALVPWRLSMQLSLYRRGGEAIIAAIRRRRYRTDLERPEVPLRTKLRLMANAPLVPVLNHADGDGAERFCRDMARREAGNFYWGFLALPKDQRLAIYALYDFARQLDDDVDGRTPEGVRARLDHHRERIRRGLAGQHGDPVVDVLSRAVQRYAIPQDEIEELIQGVERDVTTKRYRTWDELREYCRLVASTVGRMCVRIFGFKDPAALTLADDLGQAMQLTNILRDVTEDAALGRIYLPQEDLARFGISEDDLLGGNPGPGWDAFVRFQCQRARRLFDAGLRVTGMIPRTSAVCVRTMAGIYLRILDRIERDPSLPFKQRTSLSVGSKMAVAARSWLTPV